MMVINKLHTVGCQPAPFVACLLVNEDVEIFFVTLS